MHKGKFLPTFEDEWLSVRPKILRLLNLREGEHVSREEYRNIFDTVYSLLFVSGRGHTKLRDVLQQEILTHVNQVRARVFAEKEHQAILEAYISEWSKFVRVCKILPFSFAKLEHQDITSTSHQNRSEHEHSLVHKMLIASWNSVFKDIVQTLEAAGIGHDVFSHMRFRHDSDACSKMSYLSTRDAELSRENAMKNYL